MHPYDNGQSRNEILNSLKKLNPADKNHFSFKTIDKTSLKLKAEIEKKVEKGLMELTLFYNNIPNEIRDLQSQLDTYNQKLREKENQARNNEDKNIKIQKKIYELSMGREQLEGELHQNEYVPHKLNSKLEDLKNKKNSLISERSYLDRDDDTYYKDVSYENKYALTRKDDQVFKYHDIPYKKAEHHYSRGTFKITKQDNNQGIYEAYFENDLLRYRHASVKIYVEKRNLPENRKKIQDINWYIGETDHEIDETSKKLEEQYNHCQYLKNKIIDCNERLKIEEYENQLVSDSINNNKKLIEEFRSKVKEKHRDIQNKTQQQNILKKQLLGRLPDLLNLVANIKKINSCAKFFSDEYIKLTELLHRFMEATRSYYSDYNSNGFFANISKNSRYPEENFGSRNDCKMQ